MKNITRRCFSEGERPAKAECATRSSCFFECSIANSNIRRSFTRRADYGLALPLMLNGHPKTCRLRGPAAQENTSLPDSLRDGMETTGKIVEAYVRYVKRWDQTR